MPRNLKLGAILAVLVIAVVELQSWAFTAIAVRTGALRFYPPDIFSRITDAELAVHTGQGPLGPSIKQDPRPAPALPRPVCGSAFGDSMTYGSEVEDSEAWVHRLSFELDCTVVNFAVPAYGADQALLRFEQSATEGRFVLLGLFVEMIRRSVAASWTFYTPLPSMSVRQIKPLFTLEGDGLRLHAIPEPLTRESIAAHHRHDYFMRHVTTPAAFPHMFAAARAIYLRFARTDDYRRNTEKYFDPAHPSGSGLLVRRLVDRFAQVAQERGARPAIVLIPDPRRVAADMEWEQQFVRDLRLRGLCVIDLKPHLRGHAKSGKLPTAPQGHYVASGNRLIAEGVAAGLRQCGLVP